MIQYEANWKNQLITDMIDDKQIVNLVRAKLPLELGKELLQRIPFYQGVRVTDHLMPMKKKTLSRERLERPTFGSGVHCATNCANGPTHAILSPLGRIKS